MNRVKCRSCENMILVETADRNGGLCGLCANKLRTEARRKELEEEYERERSKRKKKPIVYDLDKWEQSENFFSDVGEALPEIDDPRYTDLSRHERILQTLAEFFLRTLSGFVAIVGNQHFDLLHQTHQAAKDVGCDVLTKALDELETIFLKYGFPPEPEKRDSYEGTLTDEELGKFQDDIEELDSKYFHYDDDRASLWKAESTTAAAKAYAQRHLQTRT